MPSLAHSENLSHRITKHLGVEIIKGRYTPQSSFPTEAELCETYDVSRSALREAVKMLSAKGLLVSRPRKGTRVQLASQWNLLDPDVLQWFQQTQPSFQLLREFNQMRMAIEPEAAALAAQFANADDKQALSDSLDAMEQASVGLADALDADISFHVTILQASHNRFFAQLQHLTQTALRFSIRLTNQQKGVDVADLDEHRGVAEAIYSGDSEVAKTRMTKMLQEVDDLIVRALSMESS